MTTPTGFLFYDPRSKPLSTTGVFQAGSYYQFYTTGTTNLANVYADGALTSPLSQVPGAAQPSTTADGFGRFVPIYLNPAVIYRVQLYNSVGQLLEDTDPYVVPATSVSTSGFATVTAGTSNNFQSQNAFKFNTLTWASTVATDATRGNAFICTLAGATTFSNPTGLIDGQPFVLWVVQDPTGGRTAAFGTLFQFDNVVTPTVDPTPNGITVIKGEYNATVGKLIVQLYTTAGAAANTFTLTSQQNFNLLAALGGSNGGSAIAVSITVPAGIIISSSSPLIPAMDLTGLFAGSTIALLNNGYILGAGADGGAGAGIDCLGAGTEFGGNGIGMAQNGANAGPAIVGPGASVTLNLSNANGFIWGGGGGGGGGGLSLNANFNSSEVVANAGGGGGGAGGGRGGRGGTATGMQFLGASTTAAQRGGDGVPGGTGPNGVLGAGGGPGTVLTAGSAVGSASGGGAGGDWGANGTAGTSNATYATVALAGLAGTGGNAITKQTGTVNFITGTNSAPHVKGAVA
jgi:hypothetical protein